MLNKLKQIVTPDHATRKQYSLARVARPEPPLGFVPRTDPNFYYLQKR